MNRFVHAVVVVLVILFGCGLYAVSPGAAWVLAVDGSRSMRDTIQEMRAAAIDLVKAIPDGDTLTILSAGSVTTPILTTVISAQTRTMAVDALSLLSADASYTDLGSTIATASSVLSHSPASEKRIYLFTDAEPKPQPNTRFAGRTLESLLGDSTVLASRTKLYVVVPNGVTTKANLPVNAQFIRPGEWAIPAPLPATPAVVVTPEVDMLPWVLAAGGVSSIGLLAGVGALVARRRRKRDLKADALALMPPPEPVDGEAAKRPAAVRSSGFIVRSRDQDVELTHGRPGLEVGGQWNATVLLPNADGAGVRLAVTHRGLLQVVNTGAGVVFVGALPLPAGSTRVLPLGVITLRIGAESVVAVPSNSLMVGEE